MSYDLNRHEDLFQCIDALTRASAALSTIDMDLAHEMTKIIDALARLAEMNEAADAKPTASGSVLDDLLGSPTKAKQTRPAAEDEIIDVLTGKKIG